MPPTFEEAVRNTPEITNGYKPGLKALSKEHASKIRYSNSSQLCGSVELDEETRLLYPQQNRWDYIICYNDEVYFIEVHSANTAEVSTVLRKLDWLKQWLNEKAPQIKAKMASSPYYWVQSSNFNIPKTSRQYRAAAASQLIPVPIVNLR